MKRELNPIAVAKRLDMLATIYVPESVEAARARLRREALTGDIFALNVARRLEELRALDELTHYLHEAARTSSPT